MKASPTTELLLATRQRLCNPALWTAGVDTSRENLERDISIRRLCAIHSLSAVWTGLHREDGQHLWCERAEFYNALRLLNCVAAEEFGFPAARHSLHAAARLNDTLGYEAVLKMFDMAIQRSIQEDADDSMDDSRQGAGHSRSGYSVLLDVASSAVVASEAAKANTGESWWRRLGLLKSSKTREKEYV